MPGSASSAAGLLMALLVAGCATPRLYSPLELADVAVACGVPTTDLGQEADLKKILFLYTVAPNPAQLACVRTWARKNHLHVAYIEAIEHQTEQAQP